jgi:phosphopantetheine adenylyltransferase
MLTQKKYKEKIEAFEIRSADVRDFFESFAPPSVRLEIVKLTDPYGPTITEPNVDALVVTPETYLGGQASKSKRV